MVAPRNYSFFNPDGERVDVYNLRKFCRENGLSEQNMSAVHRLIRKFCQGWSKWSEDGVPSTQIAKRPLQERFEAQFEPVTESGCWIWTGHSRKGTYGDLRINGKTKQAHRTAYELYVGEIPEGKIICHHCDEPSCVNPNHLYAGTNKENSRDRIKRGRQPTGKDHHFFGLPKEDSPNWGRSKYSQLIPELVWHISNGMPISEAARKYKLAFSTAHWLYNRHKE